MLLVRYYILGFSTPMVFNKNVFEFSRLKKAYGQNVLLKLNLKTKNSRVTTLRAPKHFKVGRHHYQIERNNTILTFLTPRTKNCSVETQNLPIFIKNAATLLARKRFERCFSRSTSVRVYYSVSKSFVVV